MKDTLDRLVRMKPRNCGDLEEPSTETESVLDKIAQMDRHESEELEECWADIRPPRAIEVVSTRGGEIDGLLTVAAEQTIFELTKHIRKKHDHALATNEVLADIVGSGIRIFMLKWREALRSQNLSGLIEIVLEGQQLTVDEMRGFVQSLPTSILQRIASSVTGSATGTHALMSLEYLRRQGDVAYQLGTTGTRIWAEFSHPRTKETVHFYLDETFKLPES